MKEVSRFRVYASGGNKYEIIEYSGTEGPVYQTPDGYKVVQLDRTNFVIEKRNPQTNEATIDAYR